MKTSVEINGTNFETENLQSNQLVRSRLRLRRISYIAVVVVALASYGTSPRAQTQPVPATTDKPSSMKHFALIFRQHPTQLSEADQKRRAQEVREWALRQNSEGHKLDPRLLDAEIHQFEPESKRGSAGNSDDGKLVAITFLEAHDVAEAMKIAQSHPGLHYGVSVEVRAWTTPPAAPRPPQP